MSSAGDSGRTGSGVEGRPFDIVGVGARTQLLGTAE